MTASAWRDPLRVWWGGRAVGFCLCIAAFTGVIGSGIGPRHATLAFVQMAVIGVLLVTWGFLELRGPIGSVSVWPAMLLAILVGLVVTGGLSAELGVQSITISYAATACYFAGDKLADRPLVIVVALGLAAVEVSGLLFTFSVGPAIGWPVLLGTSAAMGRFHRQSREQGIRLRALMDQMHQRQERDLHAAALEERHRIAREIHDVLAHSLSALGLQIEAARAVLVDTDDVGRALGLLEQAQSLAVQGLTESRDAIHVLRAESPPLPEALTAIVEARNREHQGTASLAVDGGPGPLDPEATLALIRVANEALVNAANHAPASPVELILHYDPQATTLRIVNGGDPSGWEPVGRGSGYGLAGMGERIRLLGGTFSAGPGVEGWVVMASIPR